MKIVELTPGATPRQWGQAHGESLREEIRAIGQIRLELCTRIGGFASDDEVLTLARRHMALMEGWDGPLHDELAGIAQGAGCDEALVAVINHYTDLRDLGPATGGPFEEDCTAVLAHTPEGVILGQTWDMHGSAAPYVTMVHVPEGPGVPEAWLLSIAGCVGMTGMNAHGVGVTINNLKSLDARVGVVWPALVRRMLREATGAEALEVLMGAPMSSGHHYIVADATGGVGVETSGRLKRVTWQQTEGAYAHTNHCLDGEVGACSTVPETSTTHERYRRITESLSGAVITGADDMWGRFASHEGYPRSICTHLDRDGQPHLVATCGGLVMSLGQRRLMAAGGCMVDNPRQDFAFE